MDNPFDDPNFSRAMLGMLLKRLGATEERPVPLDISPAFLKDDVVIGEIKWRVDGDAIFVWFSET